MDEIMTIDLYDLIGAEPTASVSEIKKAYRKKALTCHPDKNPNNPKAAELFHELSKALGILTDDKARAAYDQVIAARKAAKERSKQFDAKRRKLKEILEEREEAYKRTLDPTYNAKSDEERLKAEIERLQKEGSRQVEEEIAFVQKQIFEKLNSLSKDPIDTKEYRIKIRWKAQKEDPLNGGYNYDNLHRMFSKYGDVVGLVVSSSKKGRAMVEFEDRDAAETALQIEIGLIKNPLILCGLWDTQKRSKDTMSDVKLNIGKPIFPASKPSASFSSSSSPDICVQQGKMSDAEFESYVLSNLKRAEERKRLNED